MSNITYTGVNSQPPLLNEYIFYATNICQEVFFLQVQISSEDQDPLQKFITQLKDDSLLRPPVEWFHKETSFYYIF